MTFECVSWLPLAIWNWAKVNTRQWSLKDLSIIQKWTNILSYKVSTIYTSCKGGHFSSTCMNSVSRIGGNWVLQINECIIWTNVKAIGAQPTFYIVKWSQCDLNVDRRSTVTGIRNCQASNDWRCVEVANKKGVHPCFLFGIYSTGKYGELFGAAPYFLSASFW